MSAADKPGASLGRASAILVGAGAVGSTVATHLVGAGLGRLGIVDPEPVEGASSRHQPLHWTPDAGAGRAVSAATKLGLMSEDALVEPYPVRLDPGNAAAIVAGADVVLDCSGSEKTHDLVIGACLDQELALVTGEVRGAEAFVLATHPGRSACWRCADVGRGDSPPYPGGGTAGGVGADGGEERPPEDPTRGPLAGVAGSLQALASLSVLVDEATALDTLLVLSGADLTLRRVPVSRRADCPACGGDRGQPQSA